MQPTEASAPGKIILFGEHAVVYGQPALAAPVSQLRTTVSVRAATGEASRLEMPDLMQTHPLAATTGADDHDVPLAEAVRQVQAVLGLAELPPIVITVRSSIPIASGLGSGAAAAAALTRALLRHFGHPADDAVVCDLTYNVEKLYHGTPSGIDNTVVTYERPVYFQRRQPVNLIETLHVGQPLTLLVADTGVRSSTRVAVGDVRAHWQAEPAIYDALFEQIGQLVQRARGDLERGATAALGDLMWRNHELLRAMTVSAPELDALVQAAQAAGALGAKLSGAGRGGNMIALVTPQEVEGVSAALRAAGAYRVFATTLAATNPAPAG